MQFTLKHLIMFLILVGTLLIFFTSNKVQYYSTKIINSSSIRFFDLNVPELSNTTAQKIQFWYHDQSVISRTSDCALYFEKFYPVPGVDDEYLLHENASSPPLAFSHLVHKQSSILEVFLSVYFRPNNFHCIHIDNKSNATFKKAISNLIKCYSGKTKHGKIFALSEIESFSVNWGGNTMLQADIKCLQKLLELRQGRNATSKWSHTVSLAGSELPIVTYSSFRNQITQKLGSNLSSVQSVLLPPGNLNRLSDEQRKDRKVSPDGIQDKNIFEISNPLSNFTNSTSSNSSYGNSTIEFKVFKGTRNVILSFNDVDFLLNNEISKEMLNWFLKMKMSEEHFYSTVIRFDIDEQNSNFVVQNTSAEVIRRNSGGIKFTSGNTLHGICPRFTNWDCSDCFGKCYHTICNFNIKDLNKIKEDSTECLIANKFNLDVDSLAVSRQWINLLTKMSQEGKIDEWRENHPFYWMNMMEKISNLMMHQSIH